MKPKEQKESKYAVCYYPGGQAELYVGSISDYQDGGFADPVLMTKEEAEALLADLNAYVEKEYIGKNDEDNEAAHWAFKKGDWGFGIEEWEEDDD